MGLKTFVLVFCVSAVPLVQAADAPVEVLDNVVITDDQLQNAAAMVQERCIWQLDRVNVGLVHFPLEDVGIRYEFKPEVVDTYAIRRSALVTLRYEKREKSAPGAASKAIDRVVIGDLEFAGVHSWIERVFPLNKAKLFLAVPDNMTYAQALTLIQAMDANTFKTRNGVPSISLLDRPIDMSRIISLNFNAEDGTIDVKTRETRLRGQVLTFAVTQEGFELIGVAFWYA